MAGLAHCFGMEVHYYDVQIKNVTWFHYLPIEELLSNMDFIMLTCSKERNARPLIEAKELSLIKKDAFLINPARADLVDPQAVIDAINHKQLAGYAVDDTLEIFNNPSIEPGRILQTGHTAWYSTEAIKRGTETWVNNIISLAIGKPENVVGRRRGNESY